jgi:hypothetical protein
MEPTAATTADRPVRQHRPRRSRVVPWMILTFLVVGSLVIAYGVLRDRASGGHGLPPYSVYSDGPDGFAQAADLFRKLGWQPVAVTRPIQQTRHRGLLILAEPTSRLAELGMEPTLSDVDADGLLEWVGQGNTLLLAGAANNRVLDKLGLFVIDSKERSEAILKVAPGAVGEYTARVSYIAVEQPATVGGGKGVPLWWLGERPGAIVVQQGKGRVLVLPDPSPLTHRGLLRQDNAVFLYNLAALDAEEGRVYFDEYHHGIRSGGGYWSYLRYHGQEWVLIQILAVAVMAFWAVGRRLGTAVPMPVTKKADAVDYASSVARIYEKADVRPLVAGILSRHFQERLTAQLRLRRSANSGEILAAWRQRHGDAKTRELGHLLDAAQAMLQGQPPTDLQLIDLAQRFDAMLIKHSHVESHRLASV